MYRTKILIVLSMACLGCQNTFEHKVVYRADLLSHLQPQDIFIKQIDHIDSQIQFWQKKSHAQSKGHLYLLKQAALFANRFKRSGDIQDIYRSDSILNQIGVNTGIRQASVYHQLATNAVTRHEFQLALDYLNEAWSLGEEKRTTMLLAADVNMELGNHQESGNLLSKIENKATFDYLVRQAKIEDHQGDLNQAIRTMEKAFGRIHGNQNKALYCWALTNLGDMYGHAGRIRESYHCYLKVLAKDPTYSHALKGIAWIAYSHDKNTDLSMEILDFIRDQSDLPDQILLEAEIAAFMGNESENRNRLRQFTDIASKPEYKNIYNKYLCLIATEAFDDYQRGLFLALQEIEHRPTAQSYDLLAWNYFHQGQIDKAHELAETKIRDHTFEPEILYHLGAIYQAKGETGKAKKYLRMALESSYELGPVTTGKIEELLNTSSISIHSQLPANLLRLGTGFLQLVPAL